MSYTKGSPARQRLESAIKTEPICSMHHLAYGYAAACPMIQNLRDMEMYNPNIIHVKFRIRKGGAGKNQMHTIYFIKDTFPSACRLIMKLIAREDAEYCNNIQNILNQIEQRFNSRRQNR